LQTALLRAQSDKDKMETDLLKQQEKTGMMETQVQKAQKDRENLQAEMEMLLDRINKLSELLDKSRVRARARSLVHEASSSSPFASIFVETLWTTLCSSRALFSSFCTRSLTS